VTEPTIERVIRNLDQRLGEVLQILPTLATKEQVREEVRNLATKEDLLGLATKEDLLGLATKEELLGLATKDELQALATRQELALFAVRDDQLSLASKEELHATRDTLRQEIREEGARSRRHMDIVAEDLKSQLRLVTESHLMLEARERLHHEGNAGRLDAVEADVAVLKLGRAGADRA
jgi:hypothetical protein